MSDINTQVIRSQKVGIGFWLLWIVSLCLFIVSAGCSLFGLPFFFESQRFNPAKLLLIIPAGALALMLYSLVQAFKRQKLGIRTRNLLAYILWLPLLAVFLWGGGCLLSLNNL